MDSAVLITFEGLGLAVDAWRQRSPASDRGELTLDQVIPPHMTVASPAHDQPLSDAASALLDQVAESISPFALRLNRVAHFNHGTVYLAPDSTEKLDELLAVVRIEFGKFGGVRSDHVWHLTVARRGGRDLAQTVRKAFVPMDVAVDEISLWTQDTPGMEWARRHRARLLGPA